MKWFRRVTVTLAWYDMWIGAYWDKKKRILYVCPLPMILIEVQFDDKRLGSRS